MTTKKNSLDKKFRTPFGNEEEALVFDSFTKPAAMIKGLPEKEGEEKVETEETDEAKLAAKAVGTKQPVRRPAHGGGMPAPDNSELAKYSKFEDYAEYPNRGEGTKTKTFTLDSVSEAKLNSIATALDTSLRVFFSNVIDEFYEKYEKEIKKRVRNKYGV
ncbi:hypothetical protein [Parapedobacter sp. 10938]|uniref:hypothetical protein n=1 Tax=Parapedobacter flavus TaxID=3110225 RepID=UPI002DB9D33F|nr:hypothetical protein [Parapedobacter sp. 10938]MEC3881826.1 hypothetical protein [Parapedobacter sp. 10938]